MNRATIAIAAGCLLSGMPAVAGDPAPPAVQAAPDARPPCREDPRAREFDFWTGRFRVEDRDGNLLGENTITRAQEGCVLVEHWSGVRGGTGMSMNFYDPTRGQWRQVWVSPGVLIEIAGGLAQGSMVLEGHAYYRATGEKRPFRGTWTPLADGAVRQFFEESADGGRSFAPWFEGFYRPAPGPDAGDAESAQGAPPDLNP